MHITDLLPHFFAIDEDGNPKIHPNDKTRILRGVGLEGLVEALNK